MKADQEKKLIEAIGKAKTAINTGYQMIEDALMKHDAAEERLKSHYNDYSEEYMNEQHDAIVAAFDQETKEAIETAKAAIQEQKSVFMGVVTGFYRPDGKNIDPDDNALLNSGIELQNDELFDMIMKYTDNCTMLRLILKYCTVNKLLDLKSGYSELPSEVVNILRKLSLAGFREEKAFDRFVHLASAGFAHPDKNYTMFQARLDDYEEDAVIAIKKANIFLDENARAELKQLIRNQMDKHNDTRKNQKLDYGW